MRRDNTDQPQTVREALSKLRVDDLKPLVALLGKTTAKRKDDLADLLAKALEDRAKIRSLYEGLDDLGRMALQEAAHDSEGVLDRFKFEAKYGRAPLIRPSYWERDKKLTVLSLFFPDGKFLPADSQSILLGFIPEPPALSVQSHDDLPRNAHQQEADAGRSDGDETDKKAELRVRRTDTAALHDVRAILQLIDMGNVRVGDKTRRPSPDSMKAIAGVLAEGDFYSSEDQSGEDWQPSADLRIQTFAWPMLAQAARLAETAGTRLQLTAAGRKAATTRAHELIRQVWEKWQKTTLVDEFNRINMIKGQRAGRGGLTPVASRRELVVEALRECPAQKWIAIDEFFRVLKVLATDLRVTTDPWNLYISEQRYGSLGQGGDDEWAMLEGRFALTFLFEYAATLGLVDVAYVPPAWVRSDYDDHWGTDDLSCLSRYDGLMYFRINALGAWCLGLAKNYEPADVPPEPRLKVLPNLDVVTADQTIAPADVLFLDRFAERKSESLWRLGAAKILEVVEKGSTVAELKAFLEARNDGPLPQTVNVFLDDLARKAGQLEDLGAARLIGCADANVARLLAHDRRLRSLCQLTGERQLVFRATDEPAVRRLLKELGYVLPPRE
jgi:hypothetical protein